MESVGALISKDDKAYQSSRLFHNIRWTNICFSTDIRQKINVR
jgi:hypothetical protein